MTAKLFVNQGPNQQLKLRVMKDVGFDAIAVPRVNQMIPCNMKNLPKIEQMPVNCKFLVTSYLNRYSNSQSS